MKPSIYIVVGRKKFYLPIDEIAYIESEGVVTLTGVRYVMNRYFAVRYWLGILREPAWVRVNASQLVRASLLHDFEIEPDNKRGWVSVNGFDKKLRVTRPHCRIIKNLTKAVKDGKSNLPELQKVVSA